MRSPRNVLEYNPYYELYTIVAMMRSICFFMDSVSVEPRAAITVICAIAPHTYTAQWKTYCLIRFTTINPTPYKRLIVILIIVYKCNNNNNNNNNTEVITNE